MDEKIMETTGEKCEVMNVIILENILQSLESDRSDLRDKSRELSLESNKCTVRPT